MLASSFLSADQLGLSTKQHNALTSVLGMLERGELQHIPPNLDPDGADYVGVGFNMATFSCGSVHCIGGWADRTYGTDFASWSLLWCSNQGPQYLALYSLLYGDISSDVELEDISVAEAAEALRNYLTTGSAQWVQVLGEANPIER